MFIAIDMQNLVYLARHPDCAALAAYVGIQHPDVPVKVQSCMPKVFLADFSAYDMLKLYKNTTGEGVTAYNERMRSLLLELTCRFPEVDLDRDEVFALHDKLADEDEDREPYQYIKGHGLVPRPDLFAGHKVQRSTDEQQIMNQGLEKTVEQAYPEFVAAEAAYKLPSAAQPQVGTSTLPTRSNATSVPTAPRSGTVTGSIWEAANALWEEHGQPTDKAGIKVIRKLVIEQLSNINGSTLSVQLSAWSKTKITA